MRRQKKPEVVQAKGLVHPNPKAGDRFGWVDREDYQACDHGNRQIVEKTEHGWTYSIVYTSGTLGEPYESLRVVPHPDHLGEWVQGKVENGRLHLCGNGLNGCYWVEVQP